MDEGGLTAATCADEYISRIEALDRAAPQLNSVIELNPDAREIAEELDQERRRRFRRRSEHRLHLSGVRLGHEHAQPHGAH